MSRRSLALAGFKRVARCRRKTNRKCSRIFVVCFGCCPGRGRSRRDDYERAGRLQRFNAIVPLEPSFSRNGLKRVLPLACLTRASGSCGGAKITFCGARCRARSPRFNSTSNASASRPTMATRRPTSSRIVSATSSRAAASCERAVGCTPIVSRSASFSLLLSS